MRLNHSSESEDSNLVKSNNNHPSRSNAAGNLIPRPNRSEKSRASLQKCSSFPNRRRAHTYARMRGYTNGFTTARIILHEICLLTASSISGETSCISKQHLFRPRNSFGAAPGPGILTRRIACIFLCLFPSENFLRSVVQSAPVHRVQFAPGPTAINGFPRSGVTPGKKFFSPQNVDSSAEKHRTAFSDVSFISGIKEENERKGEINSSRRRLSFCGLRSVGTRQREQYCFERIPSTGRVM